MNILQEIPRQKLLAGITHAHLTLLMSLFYSCPCPTWDFTSGLLWFRECVLPPPKKQLSTSGKPKHSRRNESVFRLKTLIISVRLLFEVLKQCKNWLGFNFCCVSITIFKLALRKILIQGTDFRDKRSRVTVSYDRIDTAYQSCTLNIYTRFSRWQSWHCYTDETSERVLPCIHVLNTSLFIVEF
jgi:hypothetical protein